MDWQERFGEVFFNIWTETGLPDPKTYSERYLEQRLGAEFKGEAYNLSKNIEPALEQNLLNSVYGFGLLHGHMFNDLLGIDRSQSMESSDWCGRFNLGISLFDYLVDETLDGINIYKNLEALRQFMPVKVKHLKNISPSEDFLNRLINDLLQDVKSLEDKTQSTLQLIMLLQELFDSQLFLLQHNLRTNVNLNSIKNALYCKSAKPFCLMAKYVVGSDTHYIEKLQRASRIGSVIGKCYWLVDDAKDVFEDIAHGHWNLFALKLAENNKDVFRMINGEITKEKIEKLLLSHQFDKELSYKIIIELNQTLKDLKVSESIAKEAMGILGASLWYWLMY